MKWYFSKASLVIGFLLIGPLVLPLVWANPDFSRKKKFLLSAIVVILTCLLFVVSLLAVKPFAALYQL
ncbi:MAG: hypothetical protein WC478_06230 [Candidatus Omnitrophota bacterium]